VLDDVGLSHARSLWVATCLAQRAPLPEQIPALVERHLQRLEPLPIRVGRLTGRLTIPE
jgi:hypothetical protein